MESSKSPKVLLTGFLQKKSPGGVKGFRKWQKRYVVIDSKQITYFKKANGTDAGGVISLLDVVDAEYLPEKRIGARFDIRAKNLRTYCFDAGTVGAARQWIITINDALAQARADDDDAGERRTILEGDFSQFQHAFFAAKFGEEVMRASNQGLTRDQKLAKAEVNRAFLSDTKVLTYITTKLFDQAQTGFVYDTHGDSNDEPDAEAMIQENSRRAQNPESPKSRLINMLMQPDFVRVLGRIFHSPDEEAAHWAVRVLWALYRGLYPRSKAQAKFATQITINCSGERFSLGVKDALLMILISDATAITQNREPIKTISFFTPVVHPSAWTALFGALKHSPYDLRTTTLKDLVALFHDNVPNCDSLIANDAWQNVVFDLLSDLPLAAKGEDPVKTCYAYTLNVFTLVLTQYFLSSELFYEVLFDTINATYIFGGATSEGQDVATRIFTAVLTKLVSQKASFRTHPVDHPTMSNLFVLVKLAKKYIFSTRFWQRDADEGLHGLSVIVDDEDVPRVGILLENPVDERGSLRQRDDEATDTILPKRRPPGKDDPRFDVEEVTIMDYGLHWEPTTEGRAADIKVVEKMYQLFKVTSFAEFQPELDPTMESDEKKLRKELEAESKFWEQSLQLLQKIKKEDIVCREKMTYRRFGYTCQSWLSANGVNSRKGLLDRLQKQLDGESLDPEKRRSPSTNYTNLGEALSTPRERTSQIGERMTAHKQKPSFGGMFSSPTASSRTPTAGSSPPHGSPSMRSPSMRSPRALAPSDATPAGDPEADPANWKAILDPDTGFQYYFNTVTKGKPTWDTPACLL